MFMASDNRPLLACHDEPEILHYSNRYFRLTGADGTVTTNFLYGSDMTARTARA